MRRVVTLIVAGVLAAMATRALVWYRQLRQIAAPAEGTAVLDGWVEEMGTPAAYYAHVKTRKRGSDETLELTGGGNGDMYFVIDHGTKKGYEDMDPNVMGSGGQALGGVQMLEFVHHAIGGLLVREPVSEVGLARVVDSASSVASRMARGELAEGLHTSIDQLSAKEREVVVLRGIEQIPNGEVAKLLGEPASTVATRYARALENLRSTFPESVYAEFDENY